MKIRPATLAEIPALMALRRVAILAIADGFYSKSELRGWAGIERSKPLAERILDGTMLVAQHNGQIVGCIGLSLQHRELIAMFVSPEFQCQGLGRQLVTAIEKLAVQFGLLQLGLSAVLPAISFYQSCAYQADPAASPQPDRRTDLLALHMHKQFARRQTRFGRSIANLHRQLGIPVDYAVQHRLSLQQECSQLASIGRDVFERKTAMATRASQAWLEMQHAALSDGIKLQAVSAFRSVEYQCNIIQKKLEAGQSMVEILKVSAAPGYSEHHSGNALDITTPDFAPLEEKFSKSAAFKWLTNSAGQFGFNLSYPKNNRHSVSYEPWHWCWKGQPA